MPRRQRGFGASRAIRGSGIESKLERGEVRILASDTYISCEQQAHMVKNITQNIANNEELMGELESKVDSLYTLRKRIDG